MPCCSSDIRGSRASLVIAGPDHMKTQTAAGPARLTTPQGCLLPFQGKQSLWKELGMQTPNGTALQILLGPTRQSGAKPAPELRQPGS